MSNTAQTGPVLNTDKKNYLILISEVKQTKVNVPFCV